MRVSRMDLQVEMGREAPEPSPVTIRSGILVKSNELEIWRP